MTDKTMTPTPRDEGMKVKRYRLSVVNGVTEDRGDACHHPATTSQPMVLATDYDALAEDNLRNLANNTALYSSLERVIGERDQLKAENERLSGSLAACGVIAGCDSPESFNKWALSPDNPYHTDSLAAVQRLQLDHMKVRDGRDRLLQERGEMVKALPDMGMLGAAGNELYKQRRYALAKAVRAAFAALSAAGEAKT